MHPFEHDESVQLDPIKVHIVQDSTENAESNPDQNPPNVKMWRFVIPNPAGNVPGMLTLLGKNPRRHRAVTSCDKNNVGVIYLSSVALSSPAVQLDNAFGLGAGSQLTHEHTHEVFVYGSSPGDIIYVSEESHNAGKA